MRDAYFLMKVTATIPSWRIKALRVTQGGGGYKGSEEGARGVPGLVSVGSPPQGGEPHCLFQQPSRRQPARGVFRTQLPKFLEAALLKGICWAHF